MRSEIKAGAKEGKAEEQNVLMAREGCVRAHDVWRMCECVPHSTACGGGSWADSQGQRPQASVEARSEIEARAQRALRTSMNIARAARLLLNRGGRTLCGAQPAGQCGTGETSIKDQPETIGSKLCHPSSAAARGTEQDAGQWWKARAVLSPQRASPRVELHTVSRSVRRTPQSRPQL